MSHFPVVVALPASTDLGLLEVALDAVMAPWDETQEVAPYREYLEGAPEDHWFVGSVRDGAEHHRNGTGPARQKDEFARDAADADILGEHPTWTLVAAVLNARHPDEALMIDPDSGRPYETSTYNPASKWDYWRVGGRWSGHFTAKRGDGRIIKPGKHWDSGPVPAGGCDGGAITDLDLTGMRERAGRAAGAEFDRWMRLVEKYGAAKPWSHFRSLAKDRFVSFETAGEQYRAQPLVPAANKEFGPMLACYVERFGTTRDEYVSRAEQGAVPGYALVTLEGEWLAPGEMGWFGMSSDSREERAAYETAANTYIDGLDPATILVILDCHI